MNVLSQHNKMLYNLIQSKTKQDKAKQSNIKQGKTKKKQIMKKTKQTRQTANGKVSHFHRRICE
jgi:hypothetical protein